MLYAAYTKATTVPNNIDMVFGNPNIAKLGWAAFQYGPGNNVYNGPLVYINWVNQAHFPPAPAPLAFYVVPKIGVVFNIYKATTFVTGLTPAQIGGEAASAIKRLLPNYYFP